VGILRATDREKGRGKMADNQATLELAHRLREDAYNTAWTYYSQRMLEAAEDLEAFVYWGEAAFLRPITAA
jgi:hypothetical protein